MTQRQAALFCLIVSTTISAVALTFMLLSEPKFVICEQQAWQGSSQYCANVFTAHYALFIATMIASMVAALSLFALILEDLSGKISH